MRNLLKRLNIIQRRIVYPDSRFKRQEQYRLNPFNPLTYITIVLVITIGHIMFGVIGFWKEVDLTNPFKWD